MYVPTPADFLPRICRAALRPSKEFLKTCSYLVQWNHEIVQLNDVLTLKLQGGQSPVQRDAPIDRAITSFLGRSSFILAALPHRRQPRGGQECRRYCRGLGRTVDNIPAILHHVLSVAGLDGF